MRLRLILIKEPKTPTEWLQLVSKIIKDVPIQTNKSEVNSQVPQSSRYHNREQITFNRSWAPRNTNNFSNQRNFQNNGNKPNRFNRQPENDFRKFNQRGTNNQIKDTTHFSQELPPSPCKFCAQQGIANAYHWGQTCINRPNTSRNEMPFTEHQQMEKNGSTDVNNEN